MLSIDFSYFPPLVDKSVAFIVTLSLIYCSPCLKDKTDERDNLRTIKSSRWLVVLTYHEQETSEIERKC